MNGVAGALPQEQSRVCRSTGNPKLVAMACPHSSSKAHDASTDSGLHPIYSQGLLILIPPAPAPVLGMWGSMLNLALCIDN